MRAPADLIGRAAATGVVVVALGVGTTPAGAAPVIRTSAPPQAVAVGAGGVWVLTAAPTPTLTLYDRVTGARVGSAVTVDDPIPLAISDAPFGYPTTPCCLVPRPLVIHGGKAWTVAPARRRFVAAHIGRDGVEAYAIPVAGIPRDVTVGRDGLYGLEVKIPREDGLGAWQGHRVLDIDSESVSFTTQGPLFDPAITGSRTVFGGTGPLQLAVGAPAVRLGTRASVEVTTHRLSGTTVGPAAGSGRLLARGGGVTWLKSNYGCTLVRVSADDRWRAVPARWAARNPGGCRLRRIEADGRGGLYAIGGNIRRGERGVLLHIHGVTGRLLAPPVRLGGDPRALAPVRTGVWVADGRSRTVRFVPRPRAPR